MFNSSSPQSPYKNIERRQGNLGSVFTRTSSSSFLFNLRSQVWCWGGWKVVLVTLLPLLVVSLDVEEAGEGLVLVVVVVWLPLLLHLEGHVGAPQPLYVVQPVGGDQLGVSHNDGLRPAGLLAAGPGGVGGLGAANTVSSSDLEISR